MQAEEDRPALVKSSSRFARDTVDCLHYTRALRELGIAKAELERVNMAGIFKSHACKGE